MEKLLKNMGALNDETRVHILKFIAIHNEVCVCDIETAFDMIQSRISRHLKILKEAGFLEVDRRGKWAYYRVCTTLTDLQRAMLDAVLALDIKTPNLLQGCSMDKKVLILCTGNSCRSIIAEALINSHLEGIVSESSGVKASGRVNPNAKKVLEAHAEWDDKYHSKVIEEVINTQFDLVVTVCDNAKESCPMFPHKTDVIHIGFEDPDGKPYEAFEETRELILNELLPKVKAHFEGKISC
jgi:arsenate reductase (thioredoxin)